jgi:hypothetical protein
MTEMMSGGMMGASQATTLPDKLAPRDKMVTARVDALHRFKAAVEPTYAVLSDEQKKTADELLMGPKTSRDWRSFGAFSAFIVALFTEMYAFPLTIYLLSGWLTRTHPGLDPFSHDAGHLWSTLFGLHGDPHWSVLHILSMVAIFGGFILLSPAWKALYDAQSRHPRRRRLASMNTSGTRNMTASLSSSSASCGSGRRCRRC